MSLSRRGGPHTKASPAVEKHGSIAMNVDGPVCGGGVWVGYGQFEFDRSAGQHDEREGGLCGAEAVGAVDQGSDFVVQSLVAAVGQVAVDRGGDAVLVGTDRAGSLDRIRGYAIALGAGAPAVHAPLLEECVARGARRGRRVRRDRMSILG
jgi:hypothetical protein